MKLPDKSLRYTIWGFPDQADGSHSKVFVGFDGTYLDPKKTNST
jgi:hypothetical protein